MVMVGMMSNLPAWWQGPGERRVNSQKGLVEKAFLRSPETRPGTRGLPHPPLLAGPTASCPRLWLCMETQLLVRSPGFGPWLCPPWTQGDGEGGVVTGWKALPSTAPGSPLLSDIEVLNEAQPTSCRL